MQKTNPCDACDPLYIWMYYARWHEDAC